MWISVALGTAEIRMLRVGQDLRGVKLITIPKIYTTDGNLEKKASKWDLESVQECWLISSSKMKRAQIVFAQR
jgi:hypothetical protein